MKSHEEVMNLARALADAFVAFVDAVVTDPAPADTGQADPLPADGGGNTDDGDPSGDQPSDTTPVTDDPAPIVDPVPAEPELDPVAPVVNVVRITVADKNAEQPGTGNTIVLVQNGSSADWWKRKADDPVTGAPVFQETHATGKAINLTGCIALYIANAKAATQVWPEQPVPLPEGTMPAVSAPSAPKTPTPPASDDPAAPISTGQIIPKLAVPSLGANVQIADLSVHIMRDGAEPLVLRGIETGVVHSSVVGFAGIAQLRACAVSPDGLWRAFFGVDGDRVEITLRYGDPSNDAPATMGAYTAEMFAGEESLGRFDIPCHFWLAEWRAATSDRPQARSVDELVAQGFIPAYARNPFTTINAAQASDYAPMRISNLTPYMGQTGGRGDFGVNPEGTSRYLGQRDAASYRSMMMWAEASGTGPWHLDNANLGMYDFSAVPTANLFDSANSKPPLYVMKSDRAYPEFIMPDDAHHPCLGYVPFMLTGDPHHVRELMYQTNFYLGAEHGDGDPLRAAWQKKFGGKSFVLDYGQERAYAWMLRSVVFCYFASLHIDDPTLLPTAFWKMVLDRNRDFLIENFVHGTTIKASVFSSGPHKNGFGSWQEDFLAQVFGMMVGSGRFADWQEIFEWRAKQLIARRDPASGFCTDKPVWYYIAGANASCGEYVDNTGTGVVENLVFCGWPGLLGDRSEIGEHTLLMLDDTNFSIASPGGRLTKGVVAKQYGEPDPGKGNGFSFTLNGAPKAGDGWTLTATPVTTWAELAPNNTFAKTWAGEYIGVYFGAMALNQPVSEKLSALVPAMIEDMRANGSTVDWKYSFAV